MRRMVAVLMLLLTLCACGAENTNSAQTAVSFRTARNGSESCTFRMNLTADYGEYIREYTLSCICSEDAADFTLIAPETAAGITATVSGTGAQVSYEDTILAVENFESRRISPMAAPYLLDQAWKKGYISSTGMDGQQEMVQYLLGYGMQQLTITAWFDGETPVRAEISDGTNTLIACEITEFNMGQQGLPE